MQKGEAPRATAGTSPSTGQCAHPSWPTLPKLMGGNSYMGVLLLPSPSPSHCGSDRESGSYHPHSHSHGDGGRPWRPSHPTEVPRDSLIFCLTPPQVPRKPRAEGGGRGLMALTILGDVADVLRGLLPPRTHPALLEVSARGGQVDRLLCTSPQRTSPRTPFLHSPTATYTPIAPPTCCVPADTQSHLMGQYPAQAGMSAGPVRAASALPRGVDSPEAPRQCALELRCAPGEAQRD